MPKTMPTGIIRSPMYTGNPRIIGQTRRCGYQARDSRLQFQLFALCKQLTISSFNGAQLLLEVNHGRL